MNHKKAKQLRKNLDLKQPKLSAENYDHKNLRKKIWYDLIGEPHEYWTYTLYLKPETDRVKYKALKKALKNG